MKKIGKFLLVICLMTTLFPLPTNAMGELYQGYKEPITVNGKEEMGLRIKDGKDKTGKDNIAYCYDMNKHFPSEENPLPIVFEDSKCWYSRIGDYLSSDDTLTTVYGAEKKKKIALALFVGYPLDGYGDFEDNFSGELTEDEARYVTQNLIWAITKDADANHITEDFSKPMKDYYFTLYNTYIRDFTEETEFFPSEPGLEGDVTFHEENGKWRTGNLKITGIKGFTCFLSIKGLGNTASGLDSSVRFLSANTHEPITKDFFADEEFYIEVPEKPVNEYIGLRYKTEHAVFYFYRLEQAPAVLQPVQNLVRADIQEVNGTEWYRINDNGTSTPVKEEMIEIPVAKLWEGDEGKEKHSIRVSIMAEGKAVAQKTLGKDNGWKTSFFVPRYHANGNEISYSIAETPVPEGYKSEVTGNTTDGFIITNTKMASDEPDKPNPPDEPDESNPPDEPDKPNPPDEPDESNPSDEPDESNPSDEPDRPNPPDESDESNPSDEPDRPNPPDESDKPNPLNEPDEPNPPDEPDESNPPDEPDKPNPPDKLDKSNPPDKPDESNPPDEPDESNPPNAPDESNPPNEPDKPNPPDEPDKSNPLDKQDESNLSTAVSEVPDTPVTSGIPQTGEENDVHLYVCFMVLSVFGLFAILQSKEKRM